jgi:hypothetical protein
MSNITLSGGGGSPPPFTEFEIVTDDGTVISVGGVINSNGGTTSANSPDGIRVIANPDGSNNEEIQLTNRNQGTVTTTNATPTTIISFPLGTTPGVYTFSGDITGFDVTDGAGGSYGVISGIRTDGATAIEIGTQFSTNFEELAMVNADVDVTVSGNNVVFTVQGIAAKTINWDALFTYRFVS